MAYNDPQVNPKNNPTQKPIIPAKQEPNAPVKPLVNTNKNTD